MDWRRECRCSGRSDTTEPGKWCGRAASAEDGLCDQCRRECVIGGRAGCRVLTIEQVKQRRSDQGIPF